MSMNLRESKLKTLAINAKNVITIPSRTTEKSIFEQIDMVFFLVVVVLSVSRLWNSVKVIEQ